jgi:hypothetical protein
MKLFALLLCLTPAFGNSAPDFLVFPPEPLPLNPLAPTGDVTAGTPVGLSFNGNQALAWWDRGWRILDAAGLPLEPAGRRDILSSKFAPYGDGWITAYKDAVDAMWLRVIRPGVPSASYKIEPTPAPLIASPPALEADGARSLAVWGRATGSGVVTEGRWQELGQPAGAKFQLGVGFYASVVRNGEGWLALSQNSGRLEGRWLASGQIPGAAGGFLIATDAPVPSQIAAQPMGDGATLLWAKLNNTTAQWELLAQHVARSGTVGPRLTVATGTAMSNVQLFAQSNGSARPVWVQGSAWRTTNLLLGSGETLTVSPDPGGEAIPYGPNQTFTAATGPQGHVTLYLGPAAPKAAVFSLPGLPLYPAGPPTAISGTPTAADPAIFPLADGYAQTWLDGQTAVWARRLDLAGREVWPPVKVSEAETSLRTPAIAAGPDGLLVGWLTAQGVRIRRLDLAGNALGPAFYLDAHGADEFRALRLTFCQGKYLGVWRETDLIAYRFVNADGSTNGSVEFPAGELKNSPQVSSNGPDALILGRYSGQELRATLVGSANFVTLSNPGSLEIESPSVAWNAGANAWLATWIDERDGEQSRLHSRLVGPNGALIGPAEANLVDANAEYGSVARAVVCAAPGGWLLTVVQTDSQDQPTGTYCFKIGLDGAAGPKFRQEETPETSLRHTALVAAAGADGGG